MTFKILNTCQWTMISQTQGRFSTHAIRQCLLKKDQLIGTLDQLVERVSLLNFQVKHLKSRIETGKGPLCKLIKEDTLLMNNYKSSDQLSLCLSTQFDALKKQIHIINDNPPTEANALSTLDALTKHVTFLEARHVELDKEIKTLISAKSRKAIFRLGIF